MLSQKVTYQFLPKIADAEKTYSGFCFSPTTDGYVSGIWSMGTRLSTAFSLDQLPSCLDDSLSRGVPESSPSCCRFNRLRLCFQRSLPFAQSHPPAP